MGNIISGNIIISGATVFCESIPRQNGALQQTTSDGTGNDSFSGLASGTYRITAFSPGIVFSPKSQVVVISPSQVTDHRGHFTRHSPRVISK